MTVRHGKKRGNSTTPPKPRPTIGLIIADIVEPWQLLQWQGIVDAAHEKDFNLICFPGGEWRAPQGYDYQANVLYDLIDPARIDGVIIWSGGFDLYVGRQELREFCRRFEPLPIVSAARKLEGIPSVIMEEYESMVNAVVHLIEEHGYRRIGFIRGSKGHKGFEERYRAYRDTLSRYNLPLDPDLIYTSQGDEIATREEIAHWLLDPGRSSIEAVVGHNDTVALSALDVLNEAKVRVPEDVAVIGYDDVVKSSGVTPSLTSVRPPFYEMGCKLVEILSILMQGKKAPQQVVIPGRLIVRESCGCISRALNWAGVKEAEDTSLHKSLDAALFLQRDRLFSEIVRTSGAGKRQLLSQWVERLLKRFAADLKQLSDEKRPGAFIAALGDILQQAVEAGDDVWAWRELLSVFRLHTLPCLVGSTAVVEHAENLFRQALGLISERAQRAQMQRMIQKEQDSNILSEISEMLITTSDFEELMDILAWELPRLRIKSCYLSMYNSPKGAKKAKILLAYNEKGRINPKVDQRVFPSHRLVPEGMFPLHRRFSMVAKPLYFREDQFGFVLFEIGPRDGKIYNSLGRQLSSALKGILLVVERKRVEEALFHQAQELLRYNAELEQFAYSASHDLQEPLRKVMVFSDQLRSKYGEVLDDRGQDYLIRMQKAADRMKSLMDALLTYARVTTKALPFTSVNMAHLVQDVVSELKIHIEKAGAHVEIGELPIIEADPAQMRQLLQQLIVNAVKFRQSSRRLFIRIDSRFLNGGKRAQVQDSTDKKLCKISIKDNGIGFNEKYLSRIFQVFQQLHGRGQYEGLGVGLAICRKIVERHNGRITAKSKPGKGTTFLVTLPLRQS